MIDGGLQAFALSGHDIPGKFLESASYVFVKFEDKNQGAIYMVVPPTGDGNGIEKQNVYMEAR